MATFRAPMSNVDRAAQQKELAKRLPTFNPTIDFTSDGEGAAVVVQAKGFKSLVDILLEMPRVAVNAAGIEMAKIAAEIIDDSCDNYVPYESGDLRNSAGSDQWKEHVMGAQSITEIRMWFGAPLTVAHALQLDQKASKRAVSEGLQIVEDPSVYALDQHENLSYKHPNIGAVTHPQNKYLEKPFLKMEPTILGRLAAAISESLGGTTSQDAIISEAEGITALDPVLDRLGNTPNYPGYGKR